MVKLRLAPCHSMYKTVSRHFNEPYTLKYEKSNCSNKHDA